MNRRAKKMRAKRRSKEWELERILWALGGQKWRGELRHGSVVVLKEYGKRGQAAYVEVGSR